MPNTYPLLAPGGFNTGLMNPALMGQALQQMQRRYTPDQLARAEGGSPTAASAYGPAISPTDRANLMTDYVANSAIAPGSVEPQWPTFRNEAMRNIALASGAYDPTYISPLKRTEAQALESARYRDMATASAQARAKNPLDPTADDTHLLAAQLAGDMTGGTKRVLQSLQTKNMVGPGYSYEESLNLPMEQRPKLEAYRPAMGLGGAPSADPIVSRLDKNVATDPQFRKLMFQNPGQAEHVYESLTGRSYKGDLAADEKIQTRQNNAMMSMALQKISEGAHRDPATGIWKVWTNAEAPEGGTAPGVGLNAPKPFRQLVNATPELQKVLNYAYSPATGFGMSPLPRATPGQKFAAEEAMRDPEVVASVQMREHELGRSLSPRERMNEAFMIKNRPTTVGVGRHVLNAMGTAGRLEKELLLEHGVENAPPNIPTWLLQSGLENAGAYAVPRLRALAEKLGMVPSSED